MAQEKTPRRRYQSNRRREQAQETRRRILAAALKQFLEYGYTGATIEAIAREAGVVPLTVFAVFGNKRSILADLIGVSVGGDDQPVPLLQRSGPQSVLQEKDPVVQIQIFAKDISNILDRVAPIFEIMRMAAKTEPEINSMLAEILKERFQNLTVFVRHVSSNIDLRNGLNDTEAAEIVWAIASPEVYRLFTVDRGWSKERFSDWLGDALIRLLLP